MKERRKIAAYGKLRKGREESRKRLNSYYGNYGRRRRDGEEVEVRGDVLASAYSCWLSLAEWRRVIARNEEYVFGDQHSDPVYDPVCEKWYTERAMYRKQGVNPSQYNIIRSVLRSVLGVWSSNKTTPTVIAQEEARAGESEVLTATLKGLYNKEELWKFDLNALLHLMVTGCAICKTTYTKRDGRSDVVCDYISPRQFFVDNRMKDPRFRDACLVGCFYDISLDDVVRLFSKGSKARAEQLAGMYRSAETLEETIHNAVETFTDERLEKSFFVPDLANQGQARVIEVWRKESAECFWVHDRLNGTYYPEYDLSESQLEEVNRSRVKEQGEMGVEAEDMLLLEWEWGSDSYWKYYYLTPWGEVLASGVCPYWHENPPITFELHDFFDGKIYPFVTDLIDANKQINKLASISDLLVRYSAKSMLFVPIDSVAEEYGYDLEYIAKNFSTYDGVIPYKAKPGVPGPNVMSSIADAYGPLNVVQMFLKLSENVSGVYGALQGQQPLSGTPATMYAQQSQNSAVSLNALFESINSFRLRRDKRSLQLMQQYYDTKRYVYDTSSNRELLYDPERVKNLDFEMTLTENTDTPAYRLMINDVLSGLKQFDQENMLDLRGIVEVGNYPFKDKLLGYLNKREEALRGGGAAPEIPEDLEEEMGGYMLNPKVIREMGGKDAVLGKEWSGK